MARNDVFLNINALSPADAVVTGQQDMTAATVPELVLGDTPTFNFYFTDNTNVWPSWAGNAAYTVTWALSDAVSGDFSPAATTGNATPITGGWSVVLPLNAYDLVGLLNTKRVSQPYPVTNLWQQIRVADPSGNEITRAMFWTPIRYRAISDTQNTESASPTGGREVTVDNVNVLTSPTAAQFYAANPVPTSALGSAANGELLIGNGTGFTKATLTAGDGVTITNASGSITIDASAAQEKLTATVKNAESTPITKGQVVYLFGATGNIASVKLAYNTSDATSAKTFGVVSSSSIAANGTGLVTCVGVVDGLNLGAYQDGDTLYLGDTPGSVTATKPYAPNHLVYVGIVERANAGNGELYVKVQNGYELDEIHDVQINAPRQSGQTLIYDNTTSLWKNARITAGSNIAVTNGDGSISIGFSGTLPVANGGTGVTTSTGSGSVVLSTSPTLTTPILGTPQSGTLSSCTGLPISTGVSGLGTGVATFLATPTSANLASAVTDETGTGSLVFANTPTLVTPNIGAATGTSFNLTGSGTLGTTLTVNGTTDSSSKDTGAIVTEGGLGVEKSATIGGNLTVSGVTTSAGISNSGALTFTAAAGQIAGSIAKNATYGLTYYGVTGSSYDFALLNKDGNLVISNPTGTQNATLTGNLTVSGTGNSSVAGNLGMGATPSAWQSSIYRVIEFPYGVSLSGQTDAASMELATNAYINSSFLWTYKTTAEATRYRQNGGEHRFFVAPSGTAGTEPSFTQAVTLKNNGNFLLGTTTDGGQKLQVSGTGYFSSTLTVGSGGTGNNNGIVIANGGSGSLGGPLFAAQINGTNVVRLGSETAILGSGTTTKGVLFVQSGAFDCYTNGTLALTLDSSQRVVVASATNNGSRFTMPNNSAIAWNNAANSGDGGSLYFDNTNALQLRTGSGASLALTLDSSQNATFAGNIKTAAPSGGTAATWRLGTVASVSPTSPNRTIEVEIGGTTYYIHAKTTNN